MTNQELDAADQAKQAAQEVLLNVVHEPDMRTAYPTMTSVIDEASLREIVNIAWRHQFDPDRFPFRRDIRNLEEYVAKRVRSLLEPE